MLRIVSILALLIATEAKAQVCSIDVSAQLCYASSCKFERGSGSCFNVGRLGNCSVFLSSGHIFGSKISERDVRLKIRSATICVKGRRFQANLLGWTFSNTLDVSCWVARCDFQDMVSYPLATRNPAQGEKARILGYGPGQDRLSESTTTVKGIDGTKVIVDSNFAFGDSGGCVLGESGQVIGIIDGYRTDRRNYGVVTSSVHVRKWIRQYWPQVILATLPTQDIIPRPEPGGNGIGDNPSGGASSPPLLDLPGAGEGTPPIGGNDSGSLTIIIQQLDALKKQSDIQSQQIKKLQEQDALQLKVNSQIISQLTSIKGDVEGLRRIESQVSEIQNQLRKIESPISVELIDDNGAVIDRESYDVHNGEAIKLRFEKISQ